MPRRKSRLSRHSATAKRLRLIRSNESEGERSIRLNNQRNASDQNRVRETTAERSQRLFEQNARSSHNRSRETSLERSQRLADQNARTSNNRAQETCAERSQRLIYQNARTAATRLRRQTNLLNAAFAYDLNYSTLDDVEIGRMNHFCNNCQAQKWKTEAPGLCCSNGKVDIPKIPEPTPVLKELLLGNHLRSKHFLSHTRQYNTLFQMTSFGAKEIREGSFMPTFKIQGQVYHLIGNLLPAEGAKSEFLQIYFVSLADQLSLRSNINPNLRNDLINPLQKELHDYNSYVQNFKYNLENRQLQDMKLIIYADLKPPNEHKGRYNAPTVDEVAVLLVDEDKGPRDIVLSTRDGRSSSESFRVTQVI